MSFVNRLAFLAAAAAWAAAAAASASAATAHNSQAGSWGPNTHVCEATPYFAADCSPNDVLAFPAETAYPRAGRLPQRDLIVPPGAR